MKEKKVIEGTIIECMPGNLYRFEYDGKEKLGYVSGKMRRNHIRILIGDIVVVEIDPYQGKTSNRIIKRT